MTESQSSLFTESLANHQQLTSESLRLDLFGAEGISEFVAAQLRATQKVIDHGYGREEEV